jgi:hypothetical protein
MLGPLGVDGATIADIPETSMSADETPRGADWFAAQSASVQRTILGSQVGYDAYASGEVKLADFKGVHHDPVWGKSVYQRSMKQIRAARGGR